MFIRSVLPDRLSSGCGSPSDATLRLAMHLTDSAEDAQDIYQETFLRAYRHIGRFRFECSFYTWIYRIATNLCSDYLRRKQVHDRYTYSERYSDEMMSGRRQCSIVLPTSGRVPVRNELH